jgi:hypothetical protein
MGWRRASEDRLGRGRELWQRILAHARRRTARGGLRRTAFLAAWAAPGGRARARFASTRSRTACACASEARLVGRSAAGPAGAERARSATGEQGVLLVTTRRDRAHLPRSARRPALPLVLEAQHATGRAPAVLAPTSTWSSPVPARHAFLAGLQSNHPPFAPRRGRLVDPALSRRNQEPRASRRRWSRPGTRSRHGLLLDVLKRLKRGPRSRPR